MKRTPLKRGKPLKRSGQLRRATPLKPRSRTNKRPPAESAYVRWIRTLPCAVCDGANGSSQHAHTNTLGRSGMAQKTSNRSGIPLCAHCHVWADDSYHQLTPEDCWADYHGVDLVELVQRLNQCFDLMRSSRRVAA